MFALIQIDKNILGYSELDKSLSRIVDKFTKDIRYDDSLQIVLEDLFKLLKDEEGAPLDNDQYELEKGFVLIVQR